MTIKHKIFSTVTLIFAFITMTVFISAQDTTRNDDSANAPTKRERKMGKRGGEGRRGGHRGGKMMRGLQNLNLTDDQKTQIQGIMQSSKTANEPFHQELRAFKEKTRNGENLTDADQNRMREIRTQMKQSMEQTHNTIMAILTPEQRQQVEQQKLEREKRRAEHRQRRQERKENKNPTKDSN